MLGVPAQDHADTAVGIDHPVAGGRAAESSPMPKGAVPTDPDRRREAANIPAWVGVTGTGLSGEQRRPSRQALFPGQADQGPFIESLRPGGCYGTRDQLGI